MPASRESSVESNPAATACRKMKKGRTNRSLSIAIWTSLLVALGNCETVMLTRQADDNSIEYGFKSNHTRGRQPRFISFDSSAGKIDIDLDLSIPFLSIPLEQKSKHALGSFPMPLVKLNTKALAVFGTLMAIITFVIPLLFKQVPEQQQPTPSVYSQRPGYAKEHKRSDRGLDFTSYFGDSINEILGKSSSLTPCIERLVCSAVATAKRAEDPTSFDRIVDALASHKLFEEAVNGTAIKDAAARGRQVSSAEDCVTTYTECAFNQKILLNILKMIGL